MENEAKITPYNGNKIFLVFFLGGCDRTPTLVPPPRAPMVASPLVEFAKALFSPNIPVHAHMYVTKQISKIIFYGIIKICQLKC